ncbi:hypothetical protein DPMN_052353 [Dreissena polymorpha]|uniref:Uncharacterized protein n=1 Tax=Dreissena polymorpha TaxID=45954 RepID=A0A9D4CLT6_DREPO|nr:hypothetical protein DPMN_052353 [Dreissena polymorpha]
MFLSRLYLQLDFIECDIWKHISTKHNVDKYNTRLEYSNNLLPSLCHLAFGIHRWVNHNERAVWTIVSHRISQ